MPTELRRMTFSNAELSSALLSFYKKKNLPLPENHKVISAKIDEKDKGSDVVLTHPNSANSRVKPRPTVMPINQAAALLINFCMENDIPVPRNQRKALTVDGDNLVIVIRSELDTVDEDTFIPL